MWSWLKKLMQPKPEPPRRNLVQIRNPKTNRYILIDRDKGQIIGRKEDDGPYKGIPIAGRRA